VASEKAIVSTVALQRAREVVGCNQVVQIDEVNFTGKLAIYANVFALVQVTRR
jgi:hypothetical protein